MAQAARLNLRLQKELKLLLTDPPHGATFPHLSPDSDPSSSSSSSSLSTIHAQIRGPEGSVYAKGVFDIKIQIPERYPFQPPSVTFATPIYHPNIDNGGRICLDILNLPPKGAWQPSLNIWTVITSIGLLLSEPNPDDGLMCEASREYKYNRQAFDHKAISMTDKFAKAGVSRPLSIETKSNPSMMGVKDPPESKLDVDKHVVDNKLSGNRRKLSLEASVSNPNRGNEMLVEGRGLGSKGTLSGYSSSHDNPNGTRRRLSLESYGQQQMLDCINLGSAVDNHCPLQATSFHEKHLDQDGKSIGDKSMSSESKQLCQVTQKQPLGRSTEACTVSNLTDLQGPLSVSHAIDRHDLDPQMGSIDKVENASTNIRSKKPCLAGKKLSLGYKGSLKKAAKEDKENIVPTHKLPLSTIQSPSSKPCVGQNLSAGPMIQLQGSYGEKLQCNQDHGENMKQQLTEEPPLSETVIVLDSEDSEEEANVHLRTKLSLARRLGKWKAKA